MKHFRGSTADCGESNLNIPLSFGMGLLDKPMFEKVLLGIRGEGGGRKGWNGGVQGWRYKWSVNRRRTLSSRRLRTQIHD